jgi:hypothetical protein
MQQQQQEQILQQQQQYRQQQQFDTTNLQPQQQRQIQEHQLNTNSLPLGNPMTAMDETSAVSSIPTHLPLKTPRSPNRVNKAERVDIGIPSVHGSLGYIPSMMSFAPSHVSHDPMPSNTNNQQFDTDDMGAERDFNPATVNGGERYDDTLSHMPGGLASAPEDRKGKGKEGARRVWDEDRGVWVEGVTPHSIGPDGPGSARTKISLS